MLIHGHALPKKQLKDSEVRRRDVARPNAGLPWIDARQSQSQQEPHCCKMAEACSPRKRHRADTFARHTPATASNVLLVRFFVLVLLCAASLLHQMVGRKSTAIGKAQHGGSSRGYHRLNDVDVVALSSS